MCLVASYNWLLRGGFCRKQIHHKINGQPDAASLLPCKNWWKQAWRKNRVAPWKVRRILCRAVWPCHLQKKWRMMENAWACVVSLSSHQLLVINMKRKNQEESDLIWFSKIFKANHLGHEPNFHWPVDDAGLASKQLHKRFKRFNRKSSKFSWQTCIAIRACCLKLSSQVI